MAGSLRRRCLRYLHGLTGEAVRRGYDVQEQPIAAQHRGRTTTYGRPDVPDYSRREGELNILVSGFSYRVTIDQEHPETEDDERYDQLVVWVRGPGQPLKAASLADPNANEKAETLLNRLRPE